MKKILLIVLCMSYGIANAQGSFLSNSYVGLGLGQSASDLINKDLSATETSDDKDTAWKIFYGVNLYKNFDIEFQYNNFGEFSIADSSDSTTKTHEYESVGFSGIYKGNVSSRVQLFAKLGFHLWNADVKSTATTFTNYSESGRDLFAGVGANFNIGSNFIARVEYERFKMDKVNENDSGSDDDVDLFSASLIYKF